MSAVTSARVRDSAPQDRPGGPRPGETLRPVLWRLHFLGGFLMAPVLVSLALTGIAFAWNPQLESAIYGRALGAVSGAPERPLAEQVRAATATLEGYEVTAIVPAAPGSPQGEETTAVTMRPPDPETGRFGQQVGLTTVYVDPGSARVTGKIVEVQRPDEWIRNLHSNWRVGQGSWAEPFTELAASWALVSLLSGVYLWWPRGGGWRAVPPRRRSRGRRRWRDLHTALGLVLLVPLLAMVGTGLTWTNFAGKWVDVAQSRLAAAPPVLDTDLPAARENPAPSSWAGLDRVATTARENGLSAPIELTPPAARSAAWEATSLDSRWPVRQTQLAIAPATGRVIDRVGWDDQPLLAKATTLGILFHQAELFGLANQIGLTVLAVGLLAMIVAGYRMWWARRPAGGLGAPPKVRPLLRSVPVPLLAGFAALMVLLPVLGVSVVVFLLGERVVGFVRRRAAARVG